MQIRDGSTVQIHYTLTVDDEVVDTSAGTEPFEYEHGRGQIIIGLEEQLTGLSVGDKKDISVDPEKGYGEADPEGLRQLPRDAFETPENLTIGTIVSGSVRGHPFKARVSSIDGDSVTIDLNHELAGKTLHFKVEVVHVS